jgi:hypothetical protein
MKREFVLLAQKFDPKYCVNGWLTSTKIDGLRCIWDAGVSRGLLTKDVPYANVEKDGRFVKEQVATGLWSRLELLIG